MCRRSDSWLTSLMSLPVDQDAARPRVVEAEQQPADGRLARPRRADNGDMRSRLDLEAQPVEDLPVAVIAELDVVEHDRRATHDQRRRGGNVLHLDWRVDQLEHQRHVDQPLADRAIDHPEHIERPEQLRQVHLDHRQVADRQPPLAPAPHGVGECARHHQVHQRRLGDVEQAERVLALDRGLGIGARRRAVAFQFALLGAEILHRLVVEQRIHRAGQREAIEFVHPVAQLGAPFGDEAGNPDVAGHGHRGRDHHLPAELEVEDHRHRDHLDRGRGNVEQQEVDHRVDALRPAVDGLGHFACTP